MDIPSSNFRKKAAKESESGFVKNFYKNISSVPTKKVVAVDAATLMKNVEVPNKYKEFVEETKPKFVAPPATRFPVRPPQEAEPQVTRTEKVEAVRPVEAKGRMEIESQNPEILKAEVKEMLKYKIKPVPAEGKRGFFFDKNLTKSSAPKKSVDIFAAFASILAQESHSPASNRGQPETPVPPPTVPAMEIEAPSAPPTDPAPQSVGSMEPRHLLRYDIEPKPTEWWDAPFDEFLSKWSGDRSYEALMSQLTPTNVPKIPRATERRRQGTLKLLPTRDEVRRNNRKKRIEKQLKIQEEIKYGLRPAPANKVKMSNFHRVYGSTIANPTQLEQKARKEIEERLRRHEEHNAARKLDKVKKKQKLMRKVKRDSAKGVELTIFLTPDFHRQETQFKIQRQANQYWMNGLAVLGGQLESGERLPSVIITEAGPVYTKKFEKLIETRVKWPKDTENESEKRIKVLWKGTESDPILKEFRLVKPKSLAEFVGILRKAGLENLVSQILSHRPSRPT